MTLKQAEEFCLFHTFESFQALTFTKSLFNTRIFIYFFHENKLHPIAVRKLRNWNLSHSTQAASSVNMKERQKDFTFCDGVERWSIPALHSTTVAPGGLEPPHSPLPFPGPSVGILKIVGIYGGGVGWNFQKILEAAMFAHILVLQRTIWCSQTVPVFVMFDMFEVRFWAKMWCS